MSLYKYKASDFDLLRYKAIQLCPLQASVLASRQFQEINNHSEALLETIIQNYKQEKYKRMHIFIQYKNIADFHF